MWVSLKIWDFRTTWPDISGTRVFPPLEFWSLSCLVPRNVEELCVALPFLLRLNLFNTQVGRVHFCIALGVEVSAAKPLVAHFAHLDFFDHPEPCPRDMYVITTAKDLGGQVHTWRNFCDIKIFSNMDYVQLATVARGWNSKDWGVCPLLGQIHVASFFTWNYHQIHSHINDLHHADNCRI